MRLRAPEATLGRNGCKAPVGSADNLLGPPNKTHHQLFQACIFVSILRYEPRPKRSAAPAPALRNCILLTEPQPLSGGVKRKRIEFRETSDVFPTDLHRSCREQRFGTFLKSALVLGFLIGRRSFQQRKRMRNHLKARARTAAWCDLRLPRCRS